jgi:hypothetical protein
MPRYAARSEVAFTEPVDEQTESRVSAGHGSVSGFAPRVGLGAVAEIAGHGGGGGERERGVDLGCADEQLILLLLDLFNACAGS